MILYGILPLRQISLLGEFQLLNWSVIRKEQIVDAILWFRQFEREDGGAISPQQSCWPLHDLWIANVRQTLVAFGKRHFFNLFILVFIGVNERFQVVRSSHWHYWPNCSYEYDYIPISVFLRQSQDIAGAYLMSEIELMLKNCLFFDLPILLEVYSVQNQCASIQTYDDISWSRFITASVKSYNSHVSSF